METENVPRPSLIQVMAVFLSLTSAFSEHRTLVLTSLPKPLPLSGLRSSFESHSFADPKATSLSFLLRHSDAFSLSESSEDLFKLRLRRDASRVRAIQSMLFAGEKPAPQLNRTGFTSSVVSGLPQGSGEYFTRIGVGTPPKFVYMVLDTGSDIVWLQCSPCVKCYSQSDPVFDPSKSSSFERIPCGSPSCLGLDSSACSRQQSCLYQVSYGDGSYTSGDFSTETLTFRRTKVDQVALGCGHRNEGLFVGAAGLLGLGRGRLSFPSQTGSLFNRKFSYCLVDRSSTSRPSSAVFGDAAVTSATRFTPLLTNPKLDTFYYVQLLGISVGGSRVPGISPSHFELDSAGNGGVIIDSGTSVTRLNLPAYEALRDAFRAGASNLKKETTGFALFDTCYDLSGKTEVKVPTVVLHFQGVDISLPATNYIIPVDDGGRFCFAFAGTTSGLSIIGNIQQQGFRVVFDLEGSRVGFSPRGCA